LDLVVSNASEIISDVMIGGSLGCSNHTLVDTAVLRDKGQAKNKSRTLNFRKANFQLFKGLINRTPWEITLWDKEAVQTQKNSEETFHREQEFLILRCKKSGNETEDQHG